MSNNLKEIKRLRRALEKLLLSRGRPDPNEYINRKAYRKALRIHNEALAALGEEIES